MRTKIYFIILLLLVVNRISAQNIDNNKFPNHWIDCVINVIGSYETSTSDWGTITPNFDGQGISCGLIQLNIGQSSFQPFFLSFDQNTLERYMPIYGKKMFEICKLSKKDALIEIDRFQRNTINSKGKTIVKFNDKGEILAKELSTLLQSNEGIHKQKELMIKKANKVWNYTKEWATDIRGKNSQPTLTEFLVFYDNAIFNGSMKIDKNGDSNDGSEYMLTYKDVVEFKKRLSSNKTINDSICNWLANPMPHYDQKNEAVKNSLLWRDLLNDSNVDLFVISYLRALYSNGSTPKGRFKANVLSRRGTIIFNKGYVNGTDKLKTFACLNDSISQDEKLKNEFLLNVFSEIYSISKVNVGKNDCNVTDAYFVEGKKKNHKLYRTLVYRKGNNYYTSDEFTKWCINKMPFVSSEFDENASVEKHNSDYQLLNIFYRDFGNDSYFSLRLEDNKKDPSKKMVSILPNSELTNDLYKFPAKEECDK